MRTMNRDELRRKLQESPGKTTLVDVRERDEYEAEHIKGAISIPMHELEMRAVKLFGRDHEVILYCGGFSCPASTEAAGLLEGMGFTDVVDYKGGLEDWKMAGFMTETPFRARAA